MARSVTLAQLRSKALARAGMENTLSPTTASLNDIISDAYAEFYDLVRSCYGQGYYQNTSTISIVGGTSNYALPADFLSMLGVDLVVAGTSYTLSPFEMIERNMFSNPMLLPNGIPAKYRLNAGYIQFIPAPTGSYTATLIYVPAPTVLASDSDTIDGISGMEDFIVWSTVATLQGRVESDPSFAMARKSEAVARIKSLAPKRDSGRAPRVTDVDIARATRWPWV